MDSSTSYIIIAVYMLAVSAVFIIWFLRNLASNSEKRMTRMMQRVGLDPEITSLDDYPIKQTIKDMRTRCRKCPSEDLCERWLSGEVTGENTFCPNAPEFKRWMQTRQNGS